MVSLKVVMMAVLIFDQEGKRILIPEKPNSNGTIFTYMMKVFVYRK